MLHHALAAFAAVTLAFGALSAPTTAQEPELKPNDQRELGSLLGKALEPELKDLKKKDKALADLRKFLEKVGKAHNAKDPLQGGLSMTADLSRALYLSADYKMAGVKIGVVSTTKVDEKSPNAVSYALWLPKAYKPDQSFPVLLCMPGKDGAVQTGENFLQDNWTDPAVREKLIIAAVNLPEDLKSWTEGQTADGKPGGVGVMMLTLRDLRQRYAIDFDRVYLSGREAGVASALSLANKFPHIFAGVVGRAGDAGEVPPENFRSMPTFFAGGGAQAAAFDEAIKKLGYNNCTLKSDGTDLDALNWILEHPRQANPTKVTLVPGRPIPSRAYWLRVPPTDVGSGEVRIDGEIDRAKNTITITGTGVRQVTLMLNDVLVDLDKPVTIVLNGTSQEALLPRSLEDMVTMMFDGASEPGRVYVVRKDFDLPVPK